MLRAALLEAEGEKINFSPFIPSCRAATITCNHQASATCLSKTPPHAAHSAPLSPPPTWAVKLAAVRVLADLPLGRALVHHKVKAGREARGTQRADGVRGEHVRELLGAEGVGRHAQHLAARRGRGGHAVRAPGQAAGC